MAQPCSSHYTWIHLTRFHQRLEKRDRLPMRHRVHGSRCLGHDSHKSPVHVPPQYHAIMRIVRTKYRSIVETLLVLMTICDVTLRFIFYDGRMQRDNGI